MIIPSEGEVLFPTARLRIRGDDLPFDEITRTLGLTPTETFHKGVIHFHVGITSKADLWIYEVRADDKTLEDRLMSLGQALRPHVDYLRSLRQRYSVDISCSFTTRKLGRDATVGAVTIGHQAVALFTELEIPLRVGMTHFE